MAESRSRMGPFHVFCLLLLLLLLGHVSATVAGAPTVSTEYGPVTGFTTASLSGKSADIFLGIPFASPPVAQLRLEKPQPPSKWSQLTATKFRASCVTHDPLHFPGSEDCLYLNIMRPATPCADPAGYPVLVWIHGGAYVFGGTEMYGYQNITNNFVDKGLIVVTVTYRLGPWGYFSSDDQRVPSNLGLWDLTESLKFLNKVLPQFGGDTSRITIMGHSAGSGSVSWLTASPHSNGLFAQAVEMSGSVYAHWSSSSKTVQQWSQTFAEGVGCDYTSAHLKQCLKDAKLEDYLAVGKNYPIFDAGATFAMFNPRIDGDFLSVASFEEAFAAAPSKPTLFGLTTQEGLLWSAQVLPLFPETRPMYLSPESQKTYTRADLVAYIRAFIATSKNFKNKHVRAADELIEFYTRQGSETSDSSFYFERYTQFLSDALFNIPVLREARQKSSKNDVYLYLYDEDVPLEKSTFTIKGTTHAAEWGPLFGVFFFGGPYDYSESDRKSQSNFVETFTSFVKNGVPTSDGIIFPKLGSELAYVKVAEKPQKGGGLFQDRLQFWDRLAQKYEFDFSLGSKYTVPMSARSEL